VQITVTATALIGEVIPLRDRGRYQGALGAVFGVTTVIGPLLGRLFHRPPDLAVGVLGQRAGLDRRLLRCGRGDPVAGHTREAGHRLRRNPVRRPGRDRPDPGHQLGWHHLSVELADDHRSVRRLRGGAGHLCLGRKPFVWPESAPILPTRLFANPVFTVCCVLSFVVGFAMLGALTFLPTYMQFVDGVSATTSGLRTCRWSPGCSRRRSAAVSWSGRTGRYKIFPVAGTAVMALAFF